MAFHTQRHAPRDRTDRTVYNGLCRRSGLPLCAGLRTSHSGIPGGRETSPGDASLRPRSRAIRTDCHANPPYPRAIHAVPSSPRVRGTRPAERRGSGPGRFIPARAGNTMRAMPPRSAAPVHPRTCGEHLDFAVIFGKASGSSPRVRGTLLSGFWTLVSGRFIPARAGNTNSSRRRLPGKTVHPRACGEHRKLAEEDVTNFGSSPRVRGTQPAAAFERLRVRFIPARAGNTGGRSASARGSAVHPRACGEHSVPQAGDGGCAGSSPRVRGTRAATSISQSVGRFIPARAGNTIASPICSRPASVHPRACGEHFRISIATACVPGSSPRVRGTLWLEAIDP